MYMYSYMHCCLRTCMYIGKHLCVDIRRQGVLEIGKLMNTKCLIYRDPFIAVNLSLTGVERRVSEKIFAASLPC